ncbi:MAG: hypothetical protein DRP03_01080 [Candidatus Aenigmatarchaeota archaeon]|nr:MAG: hypothetical protein DRP03_01080 [Candidatus Aenigmarchaeota archaeon]
MKTYIKGSSAERELMLLLKDKGFSIARIAGSGGRRTPFDIIAIKRGNILVFEVKAWKTKPVIDKKKIEHMIRWCNNAGAIGIVAWRKDNKWFVMKINEFINKSDRWLSLKEFIELF